LRGPPIVALMARDTFKFGIDTLSPGLALDLARGKLKGSFAPAALKKIEESAKAVAKISQKSEAVYGVNTGLGPLCTTRIDKKQLETLQDHLLRSHSVGVGNYISPELSRLMLVLKIQSLSFAYSGVRRETLERLHYFLENDLIPCVPSQGSVGASGDLAPLAHLCLPLIGLGLFHSPKGPVEAASLLKSHKLKALSLAAKEGLALINGTQFIAAHAVLGLERLANLLDNADILGAMTLEGLMGSATPFDSRLHEVRPFAGNQHVAERLRQLLAKSEIMKAHEDCERVQDPYSLRCMPQVHGASRNAWLHLKELTHIEINSVTDNPIVFSEGEVLSGGNFHGQPLAMALDYATVAAHELGNISDRRIYLLLEGKIEGLPVFLMKNAGLNSGFMIPQYTSAALVSESKSLCFPASADSIPTSNGQEDHVSMGSISGRKLNTIIDNVEKVLAIELLCASQAFDFRRPLKSSPLLEACHKVIRKEIDHAFEDRVFGIDIAKAHKFVESATLRQVTEETATKLKIKLGGEHRERFSLY
jgi:histidine ammonia-lyase